MAKSPTNWIEIEPDTEYVRAVFRFQYWALDTSRDFKPDVPEGVVQVLAPVPS